MNSDNFNFDHILILDIPMTLTIYMTQISNPICERDDPLVVWWIALSPV